MEYLWSTLVIFSESAPWQCAVYHPSRNGAVVLPPPIYQQTLLHILTNTMINEQNKEFQQIKQVVQIEIAHINTKTSTYENSYRVPTPIRLFNSSLTTGKLVYVQSGRSL